MGLTTWLHEQVAPHIDYHQHRYARTVAKLLTPGAKWLDIGAGSRIHGGWIPPLQQDLRAKAAVLVGFDVHGVHLRQHPFLTGGAIGFAERLPFRTASVDMVTANMVLEHLIEPATVFLEVCRVLKPGGSFVFVTPNRSHPVIRVLSLLMGPKGRKFLAKFVEDKRDSERIFLTHYLANTCADVQGLAGVARLEVSELQPFSSLPMFGKIPPLLALEVLWIRGLAHPGGLYERGGSNLLGVLRKPEGLPH